MTPADHARATRRHLRTMAAVITLAAIVLGGALALDALSAGDGSEPAALDAELVVPDSGAAGDAAPAGTATPPPPATTTAAIATTTTTVPPTTTLPPTTTTGPLTTTSTRPAPRPAPMRGWLTIHGTGDVNLDPNYIPAFRSEGYAYAWTGLDDIFVEDDLTVINLECSPSPLGRPLPKTFTFRCDPEALRPAREAGVDVANLANNHGQDYGPEAMLDGRARVLANGLGAVGVGRNAAEAHQPALYDREGWRIAVLGFGGVVPAASWLAAEDRPGMADGDTIETMTAAVAAAAEIADIVIVTIHWGVELDTTPRADDIARAEAMIDAGADVIFGHHSHRLNPLGWYKGRPIFWGLGNFVWPHLSRPGATTAVARVLVSPAGEIRACQIPAFIERHGHPVLTAEPPCEEPRLSDPRSR